MALLGTLRNLTDRANTVMSPQGMSAPVQHPMHAMIAPIVGTPRLPQMVPPPQDPGPEPAAMSPADVAGVDTQGIPMPSVKQPKVRTMSPTERQESNINDKLMADYSKDANPYGSENNHPGFLGKLGHIGSQLIANAHHVSGELTPREAEEERLGKQVQGLEADKSQQALQGAQTEHLQQQTAANAPIEITPEQANELEAPELSGVAVSPAVLATLYKQHGINTQKQGANQLTNETRRDIAGIQAISKEKLAQLKPMQRDDRAIAINQKLAEGQPITPEEQSYLKAYEKYIDQTKIQPAYARGQAYGMFKPVQALNPETGQPEWNWSGEAIKGHMGTTSNIPFRTAAGMAKFMTSGKGGQTITAYNTANDHLDLLEKAMDALDNGDVQGLNRLNNAFKEQFGSAAPTNVKAVKAMLAGELANVAKVTGATDPEIQEQRDNINLASSMDQLRGFVETNHDLLDQKAYEMYQQYQQGMQGQPAFNTGLTGRGPGNVKPSGGIKAGTIEDGYKFKGGDPGKPENWEKVK